MRLGSWIPQERPPWCTKRSDKPLKICYYPRGPTPITLKPIWVVLYCGACIIRLGDEKLPEIWGLFAFQCHPMRMAIEGCNQLGEQERTLEGVACVLFRSSSLGWIHDTTCGRVAFQTDWWAEMGGSYGQLGMLRAGERFELCSSEILVVVSLESWTHIQVHRHTWSIGVRRHGLCRAYVKQVPKRWATVRATLQLCKCQAAHPDYTLKYDYPSLCLEQAGNARIQSQARWSMQNSPCTNTNSESTGNMSSVLRPLGPISSWHENRIKMCDLVKATLEST